MITLTNERPLTWSTVLASPICEFCPAVSVTMGANLPEMTDLFSPGIWESQSADIQNIRMVSTYTP